MRVLRHIQDFSVGYLARIFPDGIPANQFVVVEQEEMPVGFWQTLYEAVSGLRPLLILNLSDGENVIFVHVRMDGEGKITSFIRTFGICFKREAEKGSFLTLIATVGSDDLTWSDDCTVAGIRGKIQERVKTAFVELEKKRKEIEQIMFTSAWMIGPGV